MDTQRKTKAPHTVVYPESCQGVRSQEDDGVHRYASSVVIAAYVDKAKTSLPSSGAADNFALAAQDTNSYGLLILTEKLKKLQAELSEAPRCCHPNHSDTQAGWWKAIPGKSLQTMAAIEEILYEQAGCHSVERRAILKGKYWRLD